MAHSVSRFQLVAGLVAAALMAMGSPALAAKKKKAAEAATEGGEGLPTSGKGAEGAAQAADTERPKPMLDDTDAPAEDAQGNVTFVGAKSGSGRITVRAPKKEKAKVYLEGRYFGVAPKTIKKIPPGDYIIEVTYPNGNRVTKPVSVSGDEEAVVELGGADEATAPAAKAMPPETIEKRLSVAKVIGISAIGFAVVGLGLGAYEYTVQQDYNKLANSGMRDTATNEKLDQLARKGDTLALAANICFVGAAVGLITAGIIGYPAWKAKKAGSRIESPDSAPAVSLMFGPGRTLGSMNAGLVYRF
jgi:hypothetical protein